MASPPRFIYFDLGNVLLVFDHNVACQQMADVAGTSANQMREALFDSKLQWRYERGEVTSQQFYDLLCEQIDAQPNYAQLMHAGSAMFHLNVPVIPIVTRLRHAGYRLGILSNTCEAHWRYIIDGRFVALTELFDDYVLSFDVRSMKPEAEIFEAASRRADVAPHEIFFVDDRAENVAGARSAGFDAVQFTTPVALAKELVHRGLRLNL